MTWFFRGSLSRVELQPKASILLPFRGCAWLVQDGQQDAASPVHDATLELVGPDHLKLRAIKDEVEHQAIRCGLPHEVPSGCLYRLGDQINMVVGADEQTLGLFTHSLLASLIEGRLHLNAAIEFPGFVDATTADALGLRGVVTERDFNAGSRAIAFSACSMNIGLNTWSSDAAAIQDPAWATVADDAGAEVLPRL